MEVQRIYSTVNPAELALIKHALTTADIQFKITNEGLLSSIGVAGLGSGGSEVIVANDDAKKAKELLCSLDLVCG